MASCHTLPVERPEPGIVARLDRPERLNASTSEMFDEFVALQRDVESDSAALRRSGAGAPAHHREG